MYSRANQDPRLISLTTKTSVHNDLVVPPHSGEKPINKVREAGKVINKGYQTQCRSTSKCHIWLSYRSPSVALTGCPHTWQDFFLVLDRTKPNQNKKLRKSRLHRGTGTPIRDCARSCNSSVQQYTPANAIEVIVKAFFERLYLVPGLSPFEPRVNCPCAPTLPPFNLQLFLDFCELFPPELPLNFFSSRFTK